LDSIVDGAGRRGKLFGRRLECRMSTHGLAGDVGVGALAVIFTSARMPGDDGYAQTAEEMLELAAAQPGFLGVESARSEDGVGITVSYWADEASIRRWREQADHVAAQRAGRTVWYRAYKVRICRIEREYGFER
jgi:heme-degrading monooxygenase HmoA